MIGDGIDANLEIETEDSGCVPLDRCGGPRKVHQLFGAERPKIIEVLNRELAA